MAGLDAAAHELDALDREGSRQRDGCGEPGDLGGARGLRLVLGHDFHQIASPCWLGSSSITYRVILATRKPPILTDNPIAFVLSDFVCSTV